MIPEGTMWLVLDWDLNMKIFYGARYFVFGAWFFVSTFSRSKMNFDPNNFVQVIRCIIPVYLMLNSENFTECKLAWIFTHAFSSCWITSLMLLPNTLSTCFWMMAVLFINFCWYSPSLHTLSLLSWLYAQLDMPWCLPFPNLESKWKCWLNETMSIFIDLV